MKAIVESPVINPCASSLLVAVLNVITMSNSEEELRHGMKSVMSAYDRIAEYLNYGFGSHHMWVSEKNSKERLVLVEF